MVFALAEAGYSQEDILGIDYSSDAIKLATLIAGKRSMEKATFRIGDFLNEQISTLPEMTKSTWDLVLDKGTFDAIALGAKDDSGRSPAENYPSRIVELLRPGGVFLITCECKMLDALIYTECNDHTACNFTEEELENVFTAEAVGLEYQ